MTDKIKKEIEWKTNAFKVLLEFAIYGGRWSSITCYYNNNYLSTGGFRDQPITYEEEQFLDEKCEKYGLQWFVHHDWLYVEQL